MYARVVKSRGPAGQAEAAIATVERWLPAIRAIPGIEGYHYLIQPETGQSIWLGLYETAAALHAADGQAGRNLDRVAQEEPETRHGTPAAHEVIVRDPVEGGATFARAVETEGADRAAPGQEAAGYESVRTRQLPAMRTLSGYRGFCLLRDAATGRNLAITFWATEADGRRHGAQQDADLARNLREFTYAVNPAVGYYRVGVQG
jgi:heme-degrading monooxygenase HmoA